MRVLIYGGRDFANHDKYERGSEEWEKKVQEHKAAMSYLNKLTIEVFPRTEEDEYGNYLPAITVVSGCAKGADQLGIDYAVVNWTQLEEYPADWDKHGKAAGFIRNQQMLDSGIDLAIQFPGGNGTRDMRRRLDKAGVRVLEFVSEES